MTQILVGPGLDLPVALAQDVLEPQLYVGKLTPLAPDPPATYARFPVRNNPSGVWCKPAAHTALWTSTYDPKFGSSWCQWCMSERFEVPEDGRWQSFLVLPDPQARVYVIDTLEDLVRIQAAFPATLPEWAKELHSGMFTKNIDYEAASAQVDIIHLTEEGQWRTRGIAGMHLHDPSLPTLYGFDVECALWLNPAFSEIRDLGTCDYVAQVTEEEG